MKINKNIETDILKDGTIQYTIIINDKFTPEQTTFKKIKFNRISDNNDEGISVYTSIVGFQKYKLVVLYIGRGI